MGTKGKPQSSRTAAKGTGKPIVRYAETYHAPGLKIKAHCLPTVPSATGFMVVEAYVTKAGHLERDNERFEFQDIRVYLIDQWKCPCGGWQKLNVLHCHRCGKPRTVDAVDPHARTTTD